VVVYLRGQEGRGIGLADKIAAYALQQDGLDTVEANLALGHAADLRDFAEGVQILADLGIGAVRLLTNNPDKIKAFDGHPVRVADRVVVPPRSTEHNVEYLLTKQRRMGHLTSVETVRVALTTTLATVAG
jgi:3,4-dihydroxy 2-butanone 4-phosphate synthase/GTP cyclohydrolase II